MDSKSTKVISIRVPLDTYMEILKDSSNSKMTISDYVFQIIYSRKDIDAEICELNKQLEFEKTLKEDFKEFYKEESNLTKALKLELENLKNSNSNPK